MDLKRFWRKFRLWENREIESSLPCQLDGADCRTKIDQQERIAELEEENRILFEFIEVTWRLAGKFVERKYGGSLHS